MMGRPRYDQRRPICIAVMAFNIFDVLVFVDLRFQHHFTPIYLWVAEQGVYSKGWRLNMETVAGPELHARSDVEYCIKCSVTSDSTGANYVPEQLMCHTDAIQNVNLP